VCYIVLCSTSTIVDAKGATDEVVRVNMYHTFTTDTRHGPLILDPYR
jgi:hypothetical protein